MGDVFSRAFFPGKGVNLQEVCISLVLALMKRLLQKRSFAHTHQSWGIIICFLIISYRTSIRDYNFTKPANQIKDCAPPEATYANDPWKPLLKTHYRFSTCFFPTDLLPPSLSFFFSLFVIPPCFSPFFLSVFLSFFLSPWLEQFALLCLSGQLIAVKRPRRRMQNKKTACVRSVLSFSSGEAYMQANAR